MRWMLTNLADDQKATLMFDADNVRVAALVCWSIEALSDGKYKLGASAWKDCPDVPADIANLNVGKLRVMGFPVVKSTDDLVRYLIEEVGGEAAAALDTMQAARETPAGREILALAKTAAERIRDRRKVI